MRLRIEFGLLATTVRACIPLLKKKSTRILHGWILGSTLAAACILAFPASKSVGAFGFEQLRQLRNPSAPFPFITVISLLVLVSGIDLYFRIFKSLRANLFDLAFWLAFCSGFALWVLLEIESLRLALSTAGTLFLLSLVGACIGQIEWSETESARFHSDRPIAEEGADLLGRGSLIQEVVSVLRTERPTVMAVTGAYGSGKTSFIRLVLNQLRRFPESEFPPIIIEFNPWLPNDPNALVISFLNSVAAGVQQHFYVPGLDRQARQYGRAIASVIPKLQDAAKLFEDPSQQQQIAQLKSAISSVPRQIIVVLDDLDRLQAEELEVVLKILKAGPELPNMTFLCALDQSETALILKTTRQYQDTYSFLEKFFTVEIMLPAVDTSRLWQYFWTELNIIIGRRSAAR
jgi:hypothetical protein